MTDPPYTGPKMEARKSSGSTFVEVPREFDLSALEPRVYGTRRIEVEAEDGSVSFEEVPLLWEDLFDPQEGDWLVQGPEHNSTVGNVATALRCLMKARGVDDVMVYEDARIDWKTPGVSPVCPDVTVVFGITQEQAHKSEVFDEGKEGVSPSFLLEVTSKTTARFDRMNKPAIFRRGKVPEYVRVDRLKSPWELAGERRNPATGRYRQIRPDAQGRLLAETLEVWFSISESGDELILEDARTGEVLRTPVEESEGRRAAEQRAAEEAAAREAAERQAAEAIEARQAAEARVAEEVEARQATLKHGLRRGVEDLCAVLGLAWDVEKSAQVERMDAPQLEALRAHLVQEKSWPEPFPDVP